MSCRYEDLVKPTPEEVDELLIEAQRVLGRHGGFDRFIEEGTVPSGLLGGGSRGDNAEASESWYTSRFVAFYRPTEEEVRSAREWHEYCREHGYPMGKRAGLSREDLTKLGYPPHPLRHDNGAWVGLTWEKLRRAVQEREQQPGLF